MCDYYTATRLGPGTTRLLVSTARYHRRSIFPSTLRCSPGGQARLFVRRALPAQVSGPEVQG